MEISGVISRSYYGVGIDKVCVKSRKFAGISRCSVFSENGHLQYYVSPPMSGLKNKEKKEKKNLEMGIIKKKLKLVKGLSKNLSMFESMGFGLEMENSFISQVKGKNLEEASEILMRQLKQLKAEEKEMKRKKKEEKAKQKSMRMKTESSSSSSESSDSDYGDVVNMKSLGIYTKTESKVEGESSSPISSLIQEVEIGSSRQDCGAQMTSTSCCSSSGLGATASTIQTSSATVMASLDGERIEVCMGGKCKKSGAAELLQEFEKRVGGVECGSVAVVGCKCMGKCRDGPNVRVLNQCNGEKTTMVEEIGVVKAPLVTNPLCIGVGLEDVSMIVANFFWNRERNNLGGVMAALEQSHASISAIGRGQHSPSSVSASGKGHHSHVEVSATREGGHHSSGVVSSLPAARAAAPLESSSTIVEPVKRGMSSAANEEFDGFFWRLGVL